MKLLLRVSGTTPGHLMLDDQDGALTEQYEVSFIKDKDPNEPTDETLLKSLMIGIVEKKEIIRLGKAT